MKKGEESRAEALLLVSKTSESVAPGKIDRRSKYRAREKETERERERGRRGGKQRGLIGEDFITRIAGRSVDKPRFRGGNRYTRCRGLGA